MRKRQKRLASHGDESLPELRYRRRWGPSKALSKSSMLKFYIRENLFKVVMLSGIEQLGVNNLCLWIDFTSRKSAYVHETVAL